MSPAMAAILGPDGNYQADREVSDVDDPDLGAAAMDDNTEAGGGQAGGEAGGAGGGGGEGAC